MIRVILIGPNSRLIASIINTVTSTYIVDTTYNGLLCVDSSSIPTSVSDTDLYALWHYTTSNVWATHSASPGTYYKWISEEGASQYTWVYTEPNPVVSIISTISDFQSVTLYWNVTDSNWTDVTFSVELSKISDFSTTIDISYSGSYTDSNSTSNARTYYLRAIWLDDLNVTHYGAVVNTG